MCGDDGSDAMLTWDRRACEDAGAQPWRRAARNTAVRRGRLGGQAGGWNRVNYWVNPQDGKQGAADGQEGQGPAVAQGDAQRPLATGEMRVTVTVTAHFTSAPAATLRKPTAATVHAKPGSPRLPPVRTHWSSRARENGCEGLAARAGAGAAPRPALLSLSGGRAGRAQLCPGHTPARGQDRDLGAIFSVSRLSETLGHLGRAWTQHPDGRSHPFEGRHNGRGSREPTASFPCSGPLVPGRHWLLLKVEALRPTWPFPVAPDTASGLRRAC